MVEMNNNLIDACLRCCLGKKLSRRVVQTFISQTTNQPTKKKKEEEKKEMRKCHTIHRTPLMIHTQIQTSEAKSDKLDCIFLVHINILI